MANVNFIRGTASKISGTTVTDGQVLFDTDNEIIYMDNGTSRSAYSNLTTATKTGSAGTSITTSINSGTNLTTAIGTLLNNDATLNNNLDASNAGSHNAIYRGKYLGSSFTDAQSTAIKNGTFDDLYIGDYWTINGVNWRIAHFDYWYNCGNTNCTTHHAVIVPDSNLYTAQMNTSNTTEGGYIGSAMYTSNLETAKTTITSAFGSGHVLSVRRLFTNAVSNGKASAGSWYDSSVDLMDECMVYGSRIFTPACDGSTIPYNYTVDYKQLRLFALDPAWICNRAWYWLLNVVSGSCFALVDSDGNAYCGNASWSGGVRPAFAIY